MLLPQLAVEVYAMAQGHRILVVAPSARLAGTLSTWLRDAHHELILVTTFAAAKLHLRSAPDLMITELKLAEYNGLHLALRGRAAGIPTIVLGAADPLFEQQAEQLGAAYVSATGLEAEDLRTLVDHMLETAADTPIPCDFVSDGAVAAPFTSGVAVPPWPSMPPGGRPIVLH